MNSPAATIQACPACGLAPRPLVPEREEAQRLLAQAWTFGHTCAFGTRLLLLAALLGIWTLIANEAFSHGTPRPIGYVILGLVSAGMLQVLLTYVRWQALGVLLCGIGLIAWTALVALMSRQAMSPSFAGGLMAMTIGSLAGLCLGMILHRFIWRWVAMHARAQELGVSINAPQEEPAGQSRLWPRLGLQRFRFCRSCGEPLDAQAVGKCDDCGEERIRCGKCGTSHEVGRWREVLDRGTLLAERGFAFVLVAIRSIGLMAILGPLLIISARMVTRQPDEVAIMLALMFILQMFAGIGTGLLLVHLSSRVKALAFAASLAALAVLGAWLERLVNGAASLPFSSEQIGYGPGLPPQIGVAALGAITGCAISLLVATGIGRWLLPCAIQEHLLPPRRTRAEGGEA